MIRKKRQYSRPKKLFEKKRIAEENLLLEKYGLKNKKEVWKTQAKIDYYRNRAKDLAHSSIEEQQILFQKLNWIGIPVKSIADVLALRVENLLERRLPTLVFKKKLANSSKQARQMVVHKKVLVGGRAIDVPSYYVSVNEEQYITVKPGRLKPAKQSEPKGDTQ